MAEYDQYGNQISGYGNYNIGAPFLVGNYNIGQDELTPEEEAATTQLAQEFAGYGAAATPMGRQLLSWFNRAAPVKPSLKTAVTSKVSALRSVPMQQARPMLAPAGLPSIPIAPPNPMEPFAQPGAAPPVSSPLTLVGLTDFPVRSPAVVPAGTTVNIVTQPLFPVRPVRLICDQATQTAFLIQNPNVGGVNVWASNQQVAADMFTSEAVQGTLFPSIDTSQTLQMSVTNISGAAVTFGANLKCEGARKAVG